jgi:SAM-dependent methyltransferase
VRYTNAVTTPPPDPKPPVVLDPAELRRSLVEHIDARTTYRGEITLPAIPAAADHSIAQLKSLFEHMGKPLAPDEIERFAATLRPALAQSFASASGARVVVRYELTVSPGLKKNLALQVAASTPTLSDEYKRWIGGRDEAFFGQHPDARVMAVAAALGSPASVRVLDVGAGPGRNSLPLARRGHPVDALEPSPDFASLLEESARNERLSIEVIRADVLDPHARAPVGRYQLAIVCEVVSHFREASNLRTLLERMAQALAQGGQLLFNIFLADEAYEPDPLAREISQLSWATFFTRGELDAAFAGLPLERLADDSVVDYERAHLPSEAWPPTGWFTAWTQGYSVFPLTAAGRPPVEMRWILSQRK